jgi:tetratricopeptide (TPR) repeat protein
MLFDLRSGGRRRTVKTVYLGLALLMFVGFVGFGIGSSGLGGGIGDAITGNGSQGGGDEAAIERNDRRIQSAQAKTRATPSNPDAWSELALARISRARVGGGTDPATGQFTADGRRQLTAAAAAWDKYIALDPATPDERLARQMTQAFAALEQPAKAVAAQEMLTEIEPSEQTFSNLAIVAYQAGQLRKGDLAAGKAIDLAPKDEQKELKETLDGYKSQAAAQQIQQAVPTPTPTAD